MFPDIAEEQPFVLPIAAETLDLIFLEWDRSYSCSASGAGFIS